MRLGDVDVAFPSPQLQPINDSSPLLTCGDGGVALRDALARDGYLYLRGALAREDVLAAREVVLDHLRTKGDVFEGDSSVLMEGCSVGCLPMMEGVNALTHHPHMQRVLNGPQLRAVVAAALDTAPDALLTFDYKWLRAVGRRTFTGVHCDSVYMSRGTPQLLTCWIPLEASATLDLGALALCRASHRLPGLRRLRETYGCFDTEAEAGFQGSGWLTSDPFEVTALEPSAQWVAGDYTAGDVIVFGMLTLHMSTANLTDRVRISCDVRFQRAEEPVDDRYMGTMEDMRDKQLERKKGGAWAVSADAASSVLPPAVVTMAQLRERWGI